MKQKIITFLILTVFTLGAYARQPERGYRGFAEWSNSLRKQDIWGNGDRTTTFYSGISTSHGYQFNSKLFVGAGIDYEHCSKINSTILALFAQGRTDLKFGNLTPFGDIRLGYNLSRGGGIYFSPAIGYRFNFGHKVGINLGAGLTLQGYKSDVYNIIYNQDSGLWGTIEKIGIHHGCISLFSFRLGLDF